MFDIDGSFSELHTKFQHYQVRVEELDKETKKGGNRKKLIQSEVDSARDAILGELRMMLRYPDHPNHKTYANLIPDFHKDGSFEDSVFIMTKFPDPKEDPKLTKELDTVIQAVKDAITDRGYKPRLASDKAYHPMIWPNVELHLFGCARGVAIVEDRYRKEFNPNVALEWGWMRAMGKPVLLLVVEGFSHARADSAGYVESEFPWSAPSPAISAALKKWLLPPP